MKSRNIIGMAMLLTTAFGCSKVLDIKETDLIAGDLALKTVENCEQGTIGAYAELSTNMDILFASVLSDEVKPGEFYNSATVHEWQFSASDVTIRDNFTALTTNGIIADRVNRVLAALPKSDSTRAGDNTLRDRIKGECLFLRAYTHFELFRYYCTNYIPGKMAMPYMEAATLSNQSRMDMEPYFQKLNADLAAAKALVPASLADKNRVNQATVSALQARVALYTKDWAKAETYATEFINQLPLATMAQFPGIWTDANTAEVSYQIVRPSSSARLGSLWRGTSTAPGGVVKVGSITWLPSDKLWNMYDQTNDIRFTAYLVNEPLLTADNNRPSKIIKKYAGGGYNSTSENVANAKVFRTGEMYLIRAEARAEQNKFTGANSAESDLNDLRTARIKAYVPVVLASKDAAISAIMDERFKELPFEGHRFWDLKRRGLAVSRLASDAPNANAVTLPADNFRFVMPIPQTELNANKLMKQNDGYAQ
ncbi:RagB/SusD family nutrient uptake outer membrane protein [Chitinophaga sp. Hz27]|uniref:RagB/SusD family nutrient uptake outer membrane protein n=1 Tax=Chitinophaga sp. Hz27 TaxID=3347169 RepID=UPI0035D697CE